MPRKFPQNLKIYGVDPTVDTIVEFIQPDRVSNLVHETQIPGGFWKLSFRLALTTEQYEAWTERLFFRVRMEQAIDLLFEGRLEVMAGEINTPLLTFAGYWSNFTDLVDNNKGYVTTYNDPASDVVKEILTSGGLTQIDTADQTQIETNNVTIDQIYDLNLNYWQVLTNRTNGVLTYGDASDNKMSLAVWENRRVTYEARNPSSVDWKAYSRGNQANTGIRKLPLRLNAQNVRNAVSVLYDVSASENQTAYSIDQISIDDFLRRELVVANIGESSATPAASRRDTELASQKDLQQEVTEFVVTRVFDKNGLEQPLCSVRAGEVIQIPDLTPDTSQAGTTALNASNTFFIEQTSCRHDRAELAIRPDRDGTSLARLLARNNIR